MSDDVLELVEPLGGKLFTEGLVNADDVFNVSCKDNCGVDINDSFFVTILDVTGGVGTFADVAINS